MSKSIIYKILFCVSTLFSLGRWLCPFVEWTGTRDSLLRSSPSLYYISAKQAMFEIHFFQEAIYLFALIKTYYVSHLHNCIIITECFFYLLLVSRTHWYNIKRRDWYTFIVNRFYKNNVQLTSILVYYIYCWILHT